MITYYRTDQLGEDHSIDGMDYPIDEEEAEVWVKKGWLRRSILPHIPNSFHPLLAKNSSEFTIYDGNKCLLSLLGRQERGCDSFSLSFMASDVIESKYMDGMKKLMSVAATGSDKEYTLVTEYITPKGVFNSR